MVTTSYPRFPGDGIGSFIAPIAKGVAARGHEVHLVAPWHPAIRLPAEEDGVRFHFYRYAPFGDSTAFGYATGLTADTELRRAAWVIAPFAVTAGCWKARRIAARYHATVVHAHWVIPNGVIATLAAGPRPTVISLHGSDVFVAERNGLARRGARFAFDRAGWVTACSDDLRSRALAIGANPVRIDTVPYGVDTRQFAPDVTARAAVRQELGLGEAPFVFSAGRLVRKKGFEYLIDAAGPLADVTNLHIAIAGDGDLRNELNDRAAKFGGRVRLLGNRAQSEIARLCAAADVVAVPSVKDDAGNVDGLPNFALEALATATPVVATRTGGLPQVVTDGATGRLVAERDPRALANAIRDLLQHPDDARRLGAAARSHVAQKFSWAETAARLESAYARSRERT